MTEMLRGVFLSYACEKAEAARRICEALTTRPESRSGSQLRGTRGTQDRGAPHMLAADDSSRYELTISKARKNKLNTLAIHTVASVITIPPAAATSHASP